MEKIKHIVFDSTPDSEAARKDDQYPGIVKHKIGDTLYLCKGAALPFQNDSLPSEWQDLYVWRVDALGGRFEETGFAEYVTRPDEHAAVSASLMQRIRDTLEYKRDRKMKLRNAAPNN